MSDSESEILEEKTEVISNFFRDDLRRLIKYFFYIMPCFSRCFKEKHIIFIRKIFTFLLSNLSPEIRITKYFTFLVNQFCFLLEPLK